MYRKIKSYPILIILMLAVVSFGNTQDHDNQEQTGHDAEHGQETHVNECGLETDHDGEFDMRGTAIHHISDQNIYSIGPWHFPLPCFFYVPGQGWDIFSSAKFKADSHGNGKYAYNGYVLFEGSARRIIDPSFPDGLVELEDHSLVRVEEQKEDGSGTNSVIYLCQEGRAWKCDNKSTLDGGLFGGGITSFYDLSVSKNVASMLIVFLLLGWMFISIARAYKKREGKAPKGVQSLIEPVFVFIQEDVVKPFIGDKWETYQPFIMALFFFILGLNLFGQIPFFGGSNVTGNLAVTLALALFAFVVTNINGNRHYWQHIFWMPGIPAWVKTIVTPIEFIGLFIKPLTLMLRLFGNITAGHTVIIVFVGLIFYFGKSGELPGTAVGVSIGSVLLNLFMMAIELLVAFIQAFVFAILTASYIGAAVEEPHH